MKLIMFYLALLLSLNSFGYDQCDMKCQVCHEKPEEGCKREADNRTGDYINIRHSD